MSWTDWWVWASLGVLLLILEVIAPAYVALGFAGGAFFVAVVLALTGLASLPMALLIFAATSLATWLIIRKIFPARRGQVKRWDTDIND